MNICKKCVHFVEDKAIDIQFSRCGRNWEVSLVTGEKEKWDLLPYCKVERHQTGTCGPIGAFYTHVDNQEIITAMEDTQ